jgi:hypothetical protein
MRVVGYARLIRSPPASHFQAPVIPPSPGHDGLCEAASPRAALYQMQAQWAGGKSRRPLFLIWIWRGQSSMLQLFVSLRCWCKAVFRHSIKVSSSKGFVRKQIAPSSSACRRVVSSGTAVMNIKGTLYPWLRK